ncbi:MAG: sulfotransferase, partial [Candidatus Dormibacteraceae bacterium]
VASGIEACKWGYAGYGFEPYVKASPGNVVEALARYWYDKTIKELAFQESHPGSCHAVHYEAMVRYPEKTLKDLLAFLELDWDPCVLDGASIFTERRLRGFGDHKIAFADSIDSSSVGRGAGVPRVLSARVREATNSLLRRLQYSEIPDNEEQGSWVPDWLGAFPRMTLTMERERPGVTEGLARLEEDLQDAVRADVVSEAIDELPANYKLGVATGLGGDVVFIIDFHSRSVKRASAAGDAELVEVSPNVIDRLVSGDLDLATALGHGVVRLNGTTVTSLGIRSETRKALRILLAMLRWEQRGAKTL